MSPKVDVLIPAYNRRSALAVLLTSLIAQTFPDFAIHISDQSKFKSSEKYAERNAVIRVLESHRITVQVSAHVPRRGMAEQRQHLLDQAAAPLALFLDDNLILEPYVIENLVQAINEERCRFVGSGLIELSYAFFLEVPAPPRRRRRGGPIARD